MPEDEAAVERRNRILVSLWAYAYEFEDYSLVSDAVFDRKVSEIKPAISTGNVELDAFFRSEFSPITGMWVHKHPKLTKLKKLYNRLHRNGIT